MVPAVSALVIDAHGEFERFILGVEHVDREARAPTPVPYARIPPKEDIRPLGPGESNPERRPVVVRHSLCLGIAEHRVARH